MRQLFAFSLALAVALIPLAVSDLSRTGALPAVEASPGPLPPDMDASTLA